MSKRVEFEWTPLATFEPSRPPFLTDRWPFHFCDSMPGAQEKARGMRALGDLAPKLLAERTAWLEGLAFFGALGTLNHASRQDAAAVDRTAVFDAGPGFSGVRRVGALFLTVAHGHITSWHAQSLGRVIGQALIGQKLACAAGAQNDNSGKGGQSEDATKFQKSSPSSKRKVNAERHRWQQLSLHSAPDGATVEGSMRHILCC